MEFLDALRLLMRPAFEPPVNIFLNHMAIQLYPYLLISLLKRIGIFMLGISGVM